MLSQVVGTIDQEFPAWAQLTEQIFQHQQTNTHQQNKFTLTNIAEILQPGYQNSKVGVIAGVVVRVHGVDNPWNFGITLRDPSGEVEACIHNFTLRKFNTLKSLGTAVLLKN